MIDATIRISVPSKIQKEMLQTFKMLLAPIRREPGCVCCSCYMDIEDENSFFFWTEWQTREALDVHLQSTWFSVLSGAMRLLNENPEIRICTVASTIGVKSVTAAHALNSGSPPG